MFFSGLNLSCNSSPSNESNNPKNSNLPSVESPSPTGTLSPTTKPDRLIEIIKELQKEFVRESYGVYDGQNFTDEDLNDFINRKKTDEIEKRLKSSNDFAATIAVIREMPPAEQEKLLNMARQTYKETWGQKGLDPAVTPPDTLRKYQTDAGQEAEKMIAKTVVNLATKMIEIK